MAVAIDGPAGAGKSTMARAVAQSLGYLYIDTGAMYRAVGLKALRSGVSTRDADAVARLVADTDVDLRVVDGDPRVFLDGEDVSSQIRIPEVSVAASDVSVVPAVRHRLVDLQRAIASRNPVVMDGRDIGSHVLPDAACKIFLTASPEERARRRYEELVGKGIQGQSLEQVLADMVYRDRQDSTRALAPLVQAPDAVRLDTTGLTVSESVERIRAIVRTRLDHEEPAGGASP